MGKKEEDLAQIKRNFYIIFNDTPFIIIKVFYSFPYINNVIPNFTDIFDSYIEENNMNKVVRTTISKSISSVLIGFPILLIAFFLRDN
jgi:mannose/fructose/N-acetylgalactosamine-specific phosphotransferase system component IIC